MRWVDHRACCSTFHHTLLHPPELPSNSTLGSWSSYSRLCYKGRSQKYQYHPSCIVVKQRYHHPPCNVLWYNGRSQRYHHHPPCTVLWYTRLSQRYQHPPGAVMWYNGRSQRTTTHPVPSLVVHHIGTTTYPVLLQFDTKVLTCRTPQVYRAAPPPSPSCDITGELVPPAPLYHHNC